MQNLCTITGCKEKVFLEKTRHRHRYHMHTIIDIQNPKVTETQAQIPKATVNTINHLTSHHCLESFRDNSILSFHIFTVNSSMSICLPLDLDLTHDVVFNILHWGLIWIFVCFLFFFLIQLFAPTSSTQILYFYNI